MIAYTAVPGTGCISAFVSLFGDTSIGSWGDLDSSPFAVLRAATLEKISRKASVKAVMSSGFRLDTMTPGPPAHTTTGSSTQVAPALARSTRKLGQLVIRRPATALASIKVQGP
jgi:hypothetical protein